MKPNVVPCEFYVLMLKRADGQVYSNLAKTTMQIYLTPADAEIAMQELTAPGSWHIVKMMAHIAED